MTIYGTIMWAHVIIEFVLKQFSNKCQTHILQTTKMHTYKGVQQSLLVINNKYNTVRMSR